MYPVCRLPTTAFRATLGCQRWAATIAFKASSFAFVYANDSVTNVARVTRPWRVRPRSQESMGDGDTWRVLGQYSRMDILGHGIDLVEIDRVETLLKRSDDFLLGWFTARELSYLQTRSSQVRVVAGRVAAKEAAAKALGSGFAGDVSWQDIEILATDTGAPIVELSGGALELAKSMGVAKLTVSISHERAVAVASVIAVGAAAPFRGT